MPFSPSTYLTSQGWSGPGQALKPGGRAKPITAIKRKGLQGVGKERYTSFAWWDDVFQAVLSKVDKGKGAAAGDVHHRTATGILSPLPAPTTGASDIPNPVLPRSSSALNLDAIAYAQQNSARRQLYGRFLRGRTIEGTVGSLSGEEDSPSSAGIDESTQANTTPCGTEREKVGVEMEMDAVRRKREKSERKLARARKRALKAQSAQLSATPLSPASMAPSGPVPPRSQETVVTDHVAASESGRAKGVKSKKRRWKEDMEGNVPDEDEGLKSYREKRSKKSERRRADKRGCLTKDLGTCHTPTQGIGNSGLVPVDDQRKAREGEQGSGKTSGQKEGGGQDSGSLPAVEVTVDLATGRRRVKEEAEAKTKKKKRKEHKESSGAKAPHCCA